MALSDPTKHTLTNNPNKPNNPLLLSNSIYTSAQNNFINVLENIFLAGKTEPTTEREPEAEARIMVCGEGVSPILKAQLDGLGYLSFVPYYFVCILW